MLLWPASLQRLHRCRTIDQSNRNWFWSVIRGVSAISSLSVKTRLDSYKIKRGRVGSWVILEEKPRHSGVSEVELWHGFAVHVDVAHGVPQHENDDGEDENGTEHTAWSVLCPAPEDI